MLIRKHYLDLNLPINIKKYFKRKDVNKITKFVLKDKKNLNEKINLILLSRIGKVIKPGSFRITSHEFKKYLTSNFK